MRQILGYAIHEFTLHSVSLTLVWAGKEVEESHFILILEVPAFIQCSDALKLLNLFFRYMN
jgi:hypothetical protein